ncbi:MAG: DUF1513 domain-containing protein [Pseudomonadota bacterium]
MSRRRALALLSAVIAAPGKALAFGLTDTQPPPDAAAFAPGESDPLFAACRKAADGRFSAAVFDAAGRIVADITLPARGHDLVARPGVAPLAQELVAFARRPGNFAVAFDPTGGTRAPHWFRAPAGRHFYGHGAFSSDGRLLFTTENDIDTAEGVIGVYDAAAGYAPVDAFSSGGIGPHDLALMPDGHTLVVANGGIETHPDFGRTPLNLSRMSPRISFINTRTGAPRDGAALPAPLHRLSLRHLAVRGDGLVVLAGQHHGALIERPELIYTLRVGGNLIPLTLPGNATRQLRNYVTSVAVSDDGRRAAVSSAKGNTVGIIDLETRRLIATHALADAAGVAAAGPTGGDVHASTFVVSTGRGAIRYLNTSTAIPTMSSSWDNHLMRVDQVSGMG